ncbi:MAG: endonuclease NucS domain-containing protein [Nanoarchaeota archaeon]
MDKVRGILAAPEISPNTLQMLTDNGFEYRKMAPPKYLERFNKGQKMLGEY